MQMTTTDLQLVQLATGLTMLASPKGAQIVDGRAKESFVLHAGKSI